MKNEITRPCGLLIKLEKDALGVSHTKNGSRSNFVMGYFDRVIFDHVNCWLDFSPRKSSEGQGGNPGKTGNPLSIYPIKLLFPSNKMISHLEGLGFDYQNWMGDLPQLLESNPCITIALINLTDQFKSKLVNDICGEQLSQLADVIYNGRYYHEENHQAEMNFTEAGGTTAHVCLLPSLGYSDYCLLIAEKNWMFAPALLEYLHRARSGRKIVLSTDYVMPVYHILSKHSVSQKESALSSSQISIHIHLKPGISMGQLAQSVGDVADVWQVSGSSDCVLISKKGMTPEELFCAFSLGMVGGTKNSIQNLVLSTESKLLRMITALPQNEDRILPTEENPKIANLRRVLLKYRKLLYKENRHMRLFNATWERVTLVESICSQEHNGELRAIMDRWLDVFTFCLKQEIGELNRLKRRLASAKTEEKKKKIQLDIEDYWTDIEDALNAFVAQVGSFLADLSRSDSFSMESERYNHASVGSATKLLLAYNRWQNQFVVDMQKESDSQSEYVFLVRSGGCDSTHTDNIFSTLDSQLIEQDGEKVMFERKPLITHMSEMALFDCSGAIFRMTHECMHYCGERKRKERVQAIISFISRYYSRAFSDVLFGQAEFYEKLCAQLKYSFGLDNVDLNSELKKCWEDECKCLHTKIDTYISNQLQSKYQEEMDTWDELDYLGTELHAWLQDVLSEMFLCYNFSLKTYFTSGIVQKLYVFVLETAINYYGKCEKIIQRYDESLIFNSIERRKSEINLAAFHDLGNFTDSKLRNQINFTLSWVLSDPELQIFSNDSFAPLQTHTVSEVLDFVFACFSETFADMAACVRLDASLSDYLLAFVFESWDLNEAFPLGEYHVYRIPIILELCYPNASALQEVDGKKVLSAEAKQELNDAIQRLVMHGMPERRINFGRLCERIEELMNLYQNHGKWIAESLEQYLRLCKEQHELDAKSHSYMKKYPKAFHKIRLLDGFNHPGPDADYADQVVQMLTSLITIGKKDGDIRDAEKTEL